MTVRQTATTAAGQADERPASVALREQTSEHHKRAERSDFQRRLLGGQLPVAAYTAWLEQMWFVYRDLESCLAGPGGYNRSAALDAGSWRRTPQIESDLHYFGVTTESLSPVSATQEFLARLKQRAEVKTAALLGVVYVLEGSTNGSRYIARSLRKAYDLDGRGGLAFLDPYGDAQPERWRAFKSELDAATSPGEAGELIAAARETFDALTRIGEQLLAQCAVPGVPSAVPGDHDVS
jgi:heme oxygenase